MHRLVNRFVRYMIQKFESTGLEQELNRVAMDGKLSVPEISEIAREIAAEGIVLLKNDQNTLPIRSSDTVAVFGRCAIDYFTVGYGSGGDVVAPYRSSLMDGLNACSVRVYEPLADAYRKWCADPRNVPDEGFWGHWPMCYPEMPLNRDLVEKAAAESDLALVVIGRAAGESRENILKKGSYYLTDRELRLLRMVTAAFRRVAVIMDCGNVIDMSWTEEFADQIGAIVYAWQGGMEGGYALADVLTGTVNPSGRLSDSIARNYTDYPTAGHFGGRKYNEYAEDIYVGYRYFETFAPEKVLYPFGFGLSYSNFEIRSAGKREGNAVDLEVTVENTGTCSGRQVVQAYLESPWGLLGKPSRVLCGFAKTCLLHPGEKEKLNIRFDISDFASYDDDGRTGYRDCYLLEAGTYRVYVGSDVRGATEVMSFDFPQLQLIQQLTERGAVRPGTGFQRMHCKDGCLTFEPVPESKKDLKNEILSNLPEELISVEAHHTFQDLTDGSCAVEEFVAQLTDEQLDEIAHGAGKMNYSGGPLGNAGAFGGVTPSLQDLGIPAVITTDGPSGIRLKNTCSLLPCGTALACTFDPEGVSRLYELISREMVIRGSDMLLAPGMNIHRDPLCGRNFEYFSEDPYLTGMMGAAVVRGIQKNGRSACPKHFACNNQETNRQHHDSRVSQRALREIYLKGFQWMVRESVPLAIMTSYNLINGVWGHYHYDLVTGILRKEWGYEGLVITDWWMQPGSSPEFPSVTNDDYRIRSGVDVLMPGEFKDRTIRTSISSHDGITLAEAQAVALRVLRFILKTKADPKTRKKVS